MRDRERIISWTRISDSFVTYIDPLKALFFRFLLSVFCIFPIKDNNKKGYASRLSPVYTIHEMWLGCFLNPDNFTTSPKKVDTKIATVINYCPPYIYEYPPFHCVKLCCHHGGKELDCPTTLYSISRQYWWDSNKYFYYDVVEFTASGIVLFSEFCGGGVTSSSGRLGDLISCC